MYLEKECTTYFDLLRFYE